MMEATLIVELPDAWVSTVCGRRDAAIRFHQCVPHGEQGGRSLIEFNHPEDADEILEEISKHPSVERVEISRTDGGKITATVVNRNCRASRILASSDCFLLSADSMRDGKVRWHLVTGKEGSLNSLVKGLRDAGYGVEVERLRSLEGENKLTKRQEEALALAYKEGYYDSPKRIYLTDLAAKMGICPSTLGEILKRAERMVIEDFLDRR